MSKENVTFELDNEKKQALDAIAANMNRDTSYVLNEAIEAYLELHRKQIEDIKLALTEADAGDFATQQEVKDH